MAVIGFDEYLGFIVEHGFDVALERDSTRHKPKSDVAVIVTAEGKDVVRQTVNGAFFSSWMELPIDTLNEFVAHGLVQDAGADTHGRTIYRVTDKGIDAGRGGTR